MYKDKNDLALNGDEADFYEQVANLLAESRKYAKKQVDKTIVTTYFLIGHMIVEREQQGQKRARYGKKLLKGLSEYLTEHYGRGFSIENLQNIRKFYQVYVTSIQQTLSTNFGFNNETTLKQQTLSAKSGKQYSLSNLFEKEQTLSDQFKLNWSHYQILMRVKNDDARHFYEAEAANEQWSVRQLQRLRFRV